MMNKRQIAKALYEDSLTLKKKSGKYFVFPVGSLRYTKKLKKNQIIIQTRHMKKDQVFFTDSELALTLKEDEDSR